MENYEAKLVFNPGIARALLKRGAMIIDVKPDRDESLKSIFVFRRDEIFEKAFAELNEELKNSKE